MTSIADLMEHSAEEAQQALRLDDVNFAYYLSLYEQYRRPRSTEPLKIHVPGVRNRVTAYPLGVASTPAEISAQFSATNYDELVREYDGRHARQTILLLKNLHAGTGSSIRRDSYLARPEMARLLNLTPGSPTKIGAKGTDLLARIPDPLQPETSVELPIAELQILQALNLAEHGLFSEIVIQDVVGPETASRLERIWRKKSLPDPTLSYERLIAMAKGIRRFQRLFQAHVPVLDETGAISFDRLAPAGHGLFATEALRAVFHPESLPVTFGLPLVAAIANGEDLNSSPDEVIVDWMVKHEVPIVLLTTTKTPLDLKGGILCLVKNEDTQDSYLKVLDTAEAKAAGQIELFEKTMGLMNTNLTLFNYGVLRKKLRGMNEHELLAAMAPDLVPNWKEQRNEHGEIKRYLQLEGTMGSVIMNLDRHFRRTHGEALVSIVNVGAARRTEFFSPVKSAFDYLLQFHSDRFEIDPVSLKIKHLGGAELPGFSLKDPASQDRYYQDVTSVLENFAGTSFRELQSLEIVGPIRMLNFILKGRVRIVNESTETLDLDRFTDLLPQEPPDRPVLSDVELRWSGTRVNLTRLA